jgi:hypothetical protein
VDRSILKALAVITVGQVIVFYDHFAVALVVLFAVGLGLWMQRWTAGIYALASFVVAFAIAVITGWLHDARVWELFLGAAMAVLSGAIAGGIFQLIRAERPAEAERAGEPVPARGAPPGVAPRTPRSEPAP